MVYCLNQPSLFPQYFAQVTVSTEVFWIQFDCLTNVVGRLIQSPHVIESESQMVDGSSAL